MTAKPTPEEIAAWRSLPREEIIARREAKKEQEKLEKELRAQKRAQWEIDNAPVNTIDEENKTIDILARGVWPANVLSNLNREETTFYVDGVPCHSIEGFMQALKMPDAHMQKQSCLRSGAGCRHLGQRFSKVWQATQTLYWLDVAYPRDSEEYQLLVRKAFLARFEHSERYREALRASKGYTLLHTCGNDDPTRTVLTTQEFLTILNELRGEENTITTQPDLSRSGKNTVPAQPASPPDAVMRFRVEYFFLSNFHPSPVIYDGLAYPSSEHAYQAAKFAEIETRKRIAAIHDPGAAKRYAYQTPPTVPDWEKRKVTVMREIVFAKFNQHDDLRDRLLATGDVPLEEGNRHGDTFWGTVNGVGENTLGKILMEIREKNRLLKELPPGADDVDDTGIFGDMSEQTIDIRAKGDYPADVLSNLDHEERPFTVDGIRCHSIEGFLQALKTPDLKTQKQSCRRSGKEARERGQEFSALWKQTQTLHWLGVAYARDSREYQQLIRKAFRARFEHSERYREALRAAKGYTLLHTYGCDDPTQTVLTTREFLTILNELRELTETRSVI